MRDVVSAEEAKKLREEAAGARRDAMGFVTKMKNPNGTQKSMIDNITILVKQSEEAETSGDFRKANELAGRALTLAKAL